MKKKIFGLTFAFLCVAMTPFCFVGCGKNEKDAYMKSLEINKIQDYLYSISYDNYDPSQAMNYLEKYRPNFGCSSVQNGNLRGRNYDWYYDETAEFIIKVPATGGRHASVGVAACSLTNEEVASGEYRDNYKALPYLTLDGINDEGLIVNINVLPYGDMKYKCTSMKTETTDDDICGAMLPRLLLDGAGNIEEAIELIDNYDVYHLSTVEELHFMISGKKSATDDTLQTVVVEFIPNAQGKYDINVIGDEDKEFVDNKPIMTNFNLTGFNGRRSSLTDHAMGIERYKILSENYEMGKTKMGMLDLMKKVYYSKAYDTYADEFWYSEFCGYYDSFGDLTKDNIGKTALKGDPSRAGDYEGMVNYITNAYEKHERDKSLWQTVHTSVYDYENKTLSVMVQEGSIIYEFCL